MKQIQKSRFVRRKTLKNCTCLNNMFSLCISLDYMNRLATMALIIISLYYKVMAIFTTTIFAMNYIREEPTLVLHKMNLLWCYTRRTYFGAMATLVVMSSSCCSSRSGITGISTKVKVIICH